MYRVFYVNFVDYGIPLSQKKIVLFILANRECLIRRRDCINITITLDGSVPRLLLIFYPKIQCPRWDLILVPLTL
jgi:hypothetical protein